MIVTVDLPEDLMKEAMRLVKTGSETATLVLALQALIDQCTHNQRDTSGISDADLDME
ncbi:MAG: type II toxin-antitoxin system VapB family antitoxin [bacterium]|nr:type II toxin-antitoxin system VapB family antitoxin [bacterium]